MPTQSTAQQSEFLNVSKASQRMGLGEDAVRTLCGAGGLPGATQDHDRGPWRIPVTAVDAWLAANRPPDTLWGRVWRRLKSTRTWRIIVTMILGLFIMLNKIDIIAGFISNLLGTQPIVIWACEQYPVTNICSPTPTVTPTPSSTPTTTPTATPTPIPTPTPTPHMDRAYNIAVADLYVDNQAGVEVNTESFANGMVSVLQGQMTNTNSVLIWGPDQVGKIDSQSSTSKLEQITENINADLMIYGKLLLNKPCTVELKFYVRPRKLIDAEELSGNYELDPIHVDSCEYDNAYSENLVAASNDLLFMIDVMTNQYQAGKYQETLDALRTVEKQIMLYHKEKIGHILYLFMGNAAGKLGQYEEAEDYYQKSLNREENYVRANIGLAGVYYIQGISPQTVNLPRIEKAIALYNEVLNDNVQLGDLVIEAKARFGLGQALFIRSYEARGVYDDAEREFTRVVTIYNENSGLSALRVRAAEAHASLGMIYCENGSNGQAITAYNLAIDMLNSEPKAARKAYYQDKVNHNDCHFNSEQEQGF